MQGCGIDFHRAWVGIGLLGYMNTTTRRFAWSWKLALFIYSPFPCAGCNIWHSKNRLWLKFVCFWKVTVCLWSMSYLTISLDILIVELAHVSEHWTGKLWHLCCSLSISPPTPAGFCLFINCQHYYHHYIIFNLPLNTQGITTVKIIFIIQMEWNKHFREYDHYSPNLQYWLNNKYVH